MAMKKATTTKNQSKATVAVKSQQKVGSGFAPGSRPGVITRSGQNVFKDGKLVGRYNDEKKAQAAVSEFTSRGQNGRITNIQGDRGGETFRQLNTVNKGTQTGRANTGGIKSAVQSRGFVSEVGVDEQGNERVIGAQTPQGVRNIQASEARAKATQDKALRDSQTAYVAGQPFSRQAPVLREQVKEEEARARIAAERGIDPKTASGGQLMRLNEAVNLDVYGNAAPKFGTGADVLSTEQKVQEKIVAGKKQTKFAIPENLKTGIDSSVVTSTGAQEYTDAQIAQFQDYNQDNSDTVTSSLDSLMTSDPDILAAEAAGDDMQALLASRQAFYEEQYNSLQEEIAAIYDSKEADYKEQAAVAMGSAIAQMAAMGSFGTTTAGMQYVDGVGRKNDAAIMALASEEAAALNQAYSSFMEADFAVAEEMLTNAQATRTEIRSIKAEQLTRQKQMMELKQMEREELGSTMEMIAKAGMTSADIPEGYLDYLDSKFGYPSGTSSALFDVAAKEQTELDEKTQMESFNTMLDTLPKLSPDQYLDYDGKRYYGTQSQTEVAGTEIDTKTGDIVTVLRNKITGEITTNRQTGVLTPNVAYSKEWVKNADGTESLWWVPDDPTQGSAVPATGGQDGGAQGINSGALQQSFPAGISYAEAVKQDPTLTESDFWCLRWGANLDVRGQDLINEVGDSIQEKRASVEADIGFGEGARPPQVGDYMLTNEDSTYGHFMLINDIRTDPETDRQVAVVSESNGPRFNNGTSGGPLTVAHTRTIPLDASNLESNGGKILGFKHSELRPEFTSQVPAVGGQLTSYPEDTSDASALRKEFQATGQAKQFQEVQTAFSRVQTAATDSSPAGDIALIFSYMKMLDPSSTVREGEFATAQNSGSVPETIRAMYNKITSGERLTDVQRNDFVSQARNQYTSYAEGFKTTVDFYNKEAERLGLDPYSVTGAFVVNSDIPLTPQEESYKTDLQAKLNGRIKVDGSQLSEAEANEIAMDAAGLRASGYSDADILKLINQLLGY